MNLDPLFKDSHSRRTFFAGFGASVAGGSATLLAACGGGGGDEDGGREHDIELLNEVLDVEHAAVAAYTAALKLLRGALRETGRTFLEHEETHADALSSAITELGGAPSKAKRSYPFPDLGGETEALRFAHDVEQTQIAAYIELIPKLSRGGLRSTAAQIVTTQAEHLAVLLGELDRPQLPDAFVKGERKLEL